MRNPFPRRLLLLGVLALAVNAFASLPQVKREREFAGAINKTIKIRMKLSQSGNEIRGTYSYEKSVRSFSSVAA